MLPALRVACAAVLAAGALACTGAAVDTGGGEPADCGRGLAGAFYPGELRHDGQQRRYRVYLPAGEPARRRSLVVALHGGQGTAAFFEQQAAFASQADRHGFVVAYPEGVAGSFDAGRCCGEAARENIDDVGFVAAVAERVERDLCGGFERVYGTGFSNGAMLVHRIACERPALFDAIAPVAGTAMTDACPGAPPVPALLVHGREDRQVPWDGGELHGVPLPGVPEVVDRLAERNGCGAGERTLVEREALVCRARQACPASAPVRYCVVDGVGHQWPGGDTLMAGFGENSDAYRASAEVFAFFAAFSGAR